MAEEQNVQADLWNRKLNFFLKNTLQWRQLGTSNVDVSCSTLKAASGIDSVFAYKRNPRSYQEVIIVEAKAYETLENLNKSKIQDWIDTLAKKLEHVPFSADYQEKFSPEEGAERPVGLIALWIRDHKQYSQEVLDKYLSSIVTPKKNNPLVIYFISNQIIAQFCAIKETIDKLQRSEEYQNLKCFFPKYGDKPHANGTSIPIESLFSKILFYKGDRLIRKKSHQTVEKVCIVFYLGAIKEYHDLKLISLALKDFQILSEVDSVKIYTLLEPTEFRHHSPKLDHIFSDFDVEFKFAKLSINNDLGGYLEES